MLKREGSKWELYPYKVKGVRHDEEFEQWALPDKQWWVNLTEKWEHTAITEFEEIEVTDDMRKRYEEIRNMPEDFGDLYTQYVLDGTTEMYEENEDGEKVERELPTGHPFNIIKLRHAGEKLNSKSVFQDDLIAELAKQLYN